MMLGLGAAAAKRVGQNFRPAREVQIRIFRKILFISDGVGDNQSTELRNKIGGSHQDAARR